MKVIIFSLILFYSQLSIAIVGGTNVSPNDRIALSTVGLSNGCSGTLITENLVLTAAHCISRSTTHVLLGIEFSTAQRIAIEQRTTHPFYNPSSDGLSPEQPATSPVHDIALLKLETPVPKEFIPAILPEEQYEQEQSLVLAGFGQTDPFTGSGFGTLRKVNTLLNFYNDAALEIVFGPTPGMSACRGDSGGPMYIQEDDQLTVIGVTSRGFQSLGPCSGNGNYTDVLAHLSWIEEVKNELD